VPPSRSLRTIFIFCLVLLVSACATRSPPARDRSAGARPADAVHEVRTGDTLYSIAWEAGHDYRQVAAWNGIEPPYLIRPGQSIRLSPPSVPVGGGTAEHVVMPGETLYGIAAATDVRYQDLARWNSVDPPYLLKPGQRLRLTPPEKSGGRPATAARAPATHRGPPVARDDFERPGEVKWVWPADGVIAARFAGSSKGIDIHGAAGQPIRAAASGRVVYQGSGLRGYGQLIIVKHSADFLSAYAHCAAIYVQEGSVIKPGQVIATMGSTGTDRVKLHFEIRRRGVPVDPMVHLPKK
jgi:lipoprotein NlpD